MDSDFVSRVWVRVREEEARYDRMVELEQELGVIDPEREDIDNAVDLRMAQLHDGPLHRLEALQTVLNGDRQ